MKSSITETVVYLIYALFAWLNIELDLFFILICFMIFDTAVGVLKVLKIDRRSFNFKKLIWGLVSKLGLLIIPLLVALLFKGLEIESVESVGLSIGVVVIVKILIVAEFISSISNIYTFRTGIEVEDIDIFTMLFKFLRNGSLVILSKFTGIKIEDNLKSKDEK